ncbi:MAG: glycosyltransferase family 8 protein [Janthinobacterium lividum]
MNPPIELLNGAPMICARLYLASILESEYEIITYLDGDTQIVGDVRPLANCIPREGTILAAPDVMSLMIRDQRREWRDRAVYFRRIGLPDKSHESYFNSGVMKAFRSDWAAFSIDCLSLLSKPDSKDFHFRDQDALNLILQGRHDPISLRWNWPGFLVPKAFEGIVEPKIIHFMSKPRPWDGSFPPWGLAASTPYRDFVLKHPGLAQLYRPFKGWNFLRYQMQQRAKSIIEDFNSVSMRSRIELSEQRAIV